MFQTDIVYLQTKTQVNTYGSIKTTWTKGLGVKCDVQDINKETAFRDYGLTDETLYKQIFDLTHANWVLGDQVEYQSEQWLVRLVNGQMSKLNLSNHTFVILSKVV